MPNQGELVVYKTIEKNICENNTKVIFNETIRYINSSVDCPKYAGCNLTNQTLVINECNSTYVLSLIRRLKFLEGRQDEYYSSNCTECYEDLNNCSTHYDEVMEKLNDITDID